MRITSAGRVPATPAWRPPATGPTTAPATTFTSVLKHAVNQANQLENQARLMDARLAAGDQVDLHDVVIASEQARLALDLVIQVRNKAIEAYQEIMRMQI
jgi:flagellar hook-basal body complex protein FliE